MISNHFNAVERVNNIDKELLQRKKANAKKDI
jgi:hypothetical protein